MDYGIAIILTLLFSAFFSGMEIAFISSNRLKIELDKDKDTRSRIIAKFAKIPSKFVGALLLGNNVALVFYGIYMSEVLDPIIIDLLPENLQSEFLLLFIQTIVSTIIILLIAEFIPKVLFQLKSNSILRAFALPVSIFYYFFYPLIHIYTGISQFIIKYILRTPISDDEIKFGYADLHNYVDEYSVSKEDDGEIVIEDIKLIKNAIDFNSLRLRNCMIPRTDLITVEENDSIEELKQHFIKSGYSRIPVYRQNIDNIIGYVHSGDLFKNPTEIKSLIRDIPFFPETMKTKDIISKFTEKNKSIAIVLDEFGGTAGIITLEDLIEEILGEIDDEFDEEEKNIEKISEKEYILSGRLEIDYFNENYNIELPKSEEYETLAGLILQHHESIPQVEEIIQIDNMTFRIESAKDNRIDSIRLKVNE